MSANEADSLTGAGSAEASQRRADRRRRQVAREKREHERQERGGSRASADGATPPADAAGEEPPAGDPRAAEPSFAGDESVEANVLLALPGLARIGISAWWRTTGWVAGASVQAGSRVLRAAVSGESAAELFQAAGGELRDYARRLLRVMDDAGAPSSASSPSAGDDEGNGLTGTTLRERGAELLRRSADVHYAEDDAHPAYARILDQLAPDEGRILRLLALYGPQPSVDVRTGMLPINVGSELVAPGLTMIAAEAGCRNPAQVPAYLNNLFRLGLIWFSREPVPDPTRYQVLEAQPEVVNAMSEGGRARTVRRSIHLTPFGEDFCETCLPLHTAELDALPGGTAGGDTSHAGEARAR